jgi:trimeric autotransporter adhesin
MLLTQSSPLRSLFFITAMALLAPPATLRARTVASSAASQTIPQVASRLTQPIDANSRVTLSGTVHPLARAANDRGAVSGGLQLNRIQMVLKRSDTQESALHQLISDMHTPGAASYHKWLTPDQFGQQFGPSDADVATIESWLQSQGFGSIKLNPGRQTIEFSGSAAQFQTTFHAAIHTYQVNGETHFANSTEPQIPAALASVVGGFSSLNNFRVKSHSKLLGKASYDKSTNKATPQWTRPGGGSLPSLVLSPADFAIQYDLPAASSGTTGTNQTIAIVNDSNINPTLVANFRSLFGLPASAPNVIIDGNDPGIDGINNPGGPNGDSIEAYLDVEWAGAVAPNATIDLVIGADTALSTGLILAAEHAVYNNVAPVLSLSFGNCESALGSSNTFLSQLWEQAAAQGITVLVSTGDSGSAGCDDSVTQSYAVGGQAVSGYASTPYNVAVGGTDFFYSSYNQSPSAVTTQLGQYWNLNATTSPAASIKGYIPEQPWNDSQYGQDLLVFPAGVSVIAGGSGGASTKGLVTVNTMGTTSGPYPKPSWQTGAGVPADNARDLPDVSLFAADGINASFTPICAVDGDCQTGSSGVQISGVGGTSVAAPSFAGIMALVNQLYGPQGQANFVLYPLATQFPAAFHDVTTGTISVPCNVGITSSGQAALGCIPVANPETVKDQTFGTAVEGQIGVTSNGTTTPQYNATQGYDLATGLGSVDASVLLADWGKVKFTSSNVTLTPSSTSFTHGTGITVNGSVAGTGSVTPTGTVALMTDSIEPQQAGQITFPLTNGTFTSDTTTSTKTVTYLPGGTYNIWGQYSGDSTNAAATSPKTQITVTPENSSLFFNLLNATGSRATTTSVQYGTQLILSGQAFPTTFYNTCVVPNPPPASCSTASITTPTGTVTFSDGGTTLNKATVNAEGDAEFNAPFSVGTHSVTAAYSGDNSYNASTASAVSFTVAKATPQIGFANPSFGTGTTVPGGQAEVFTIQVENTANLANLQNSGVGGYVPVAPPTGSVTISGLPSGVPATAPLASAVDAGTTFVESTAAIVAPASTTPGTYTVTISYSGDANYNAATVMTQVIIAAASTTTAATTTTVAAAPATSTSVTSGITLTATVSAPSGQPAPAGSVAFTTAQGGSTVLLGQGTLTASGANTATASFVVNTQNLQPGSNQITAYYMGSTTYQTSSAVIAITSGPNFTLSGGAVTATRGTPATSTITITPNGGFTGNLALTCAVVGPAGATSAPTCSISAPAAISGTTPVTATLTVNTTATTTVGLANPLRRIFAAGGGVTLAALLLFGLPVRRRNLLTLKSLLSLLLFAVIAGAAIGCGGGSSSTTNPSNPTGGTTTGGYTVNVTAVGTSASPNSTNPGPAAQTMSVALTVN